MANTPGAYCNIASAATLTATRSTRRLYWPPELRQQKQQQTRRQRGNSASSSSAASSSTTGGSISYYGTVRDDHNYVYLSMILCGIGFLLPYNTFVTAVDFYQARYPDSTIIFDISLVYICVALASVFLNNILVELLSLDTRILFGYGSSLLVLLYVTVFDLTGCTHCPASTASYHLTLFSVAVVSFGCTVQQSSFYGFTSMLPRRYTQAVMTGESTLIFFIVGIVCIVSCCAVYCMARRTRFVRYHVDECRKAVIASKQERGRICKANENIDMIRVGDNQYGKLRLQDDDEEDVSFEPIRKSSNNSNYGLINEIYTEESNVSVIGGHQQTNNARDLIDGFSNSYSNMYVSKFYRNVKLGFQRRYDVARIIWPYMVSISITYFITLCLFPGIESEIISCRLKSWMPVLLIAIFNFFDLVGKLLSSIHYDWPVARLLGYSSLRILIVPAMMLCAIPRDSPILSLDGFAMTCSLVLGLSNGYFGSVPMILAPGKVPAAHKELTGNIMTISYSIGLTVGSVTAYLLDNILGDRLPEGVTCPQLYTTLNQSVTATTSALGLNSTI